MNSFAHTNNLNNVRDKLKINALGDYFKDSYSDAYKETEAKKAELLSTIDANDIEGQFKATLTHAINNPVNTGINTFRDLTSSTAALRCLEVIPL